MAKVRKGILDGFIGKLGTVVGSFWKGKKVMRSYNEYPADPRTEKQQAVRAKFGLLGRLSGALLNALQMGLGQFADKYVSTPTASFVELNYGNVTGSTPETLAVAYDRMVLSTGHLTGVGFGAIDTDTALSIKVPITASNMGTPHVKEQDRVYLVAYSPDWNQSMLSDGSAVRIDDAVSLTVPPAWQGLTVHVYGFVMAADGADTPFLLSDSTYLGSAEIN